MCLVFLLNYGDLFAYYAALFSSASERFIVIVMKQIQVLRKGHSKHGYQKLSLWKRPLIWDLCLDFIGVLHALGIRSDCQILMKKGVSNHLRNEWYLHSMKPFSSSKFISFWTIPLKINAWKMKSPFF